MITGSGNIAERFVQHSVNADGSTGRSFEQLNENSVKRMTAENTMKAVAIRNGKKLDNIVTGILTQYPDQLSAYIIAHGEVPFKTNPIKLAVQAILIRAKDVAAQSKMIDTTDDDALCDIENSEMAAQSNNTPDNETVLDTDAQAAMKIAIDHIRDMHESIGGDGSLSSSLKDMENFAIIKGNANNSDGDCDYFNLPGLATIDTGTTPDPLMRFPPITAGPAPTVNSSGIVNSGSGSGVLDTISSILAGIGAVAGSVTNAANSVGTAGGAIHNAVSNVGASSISTFISQNKGTILFAVLAIAVLLFVVIYAAKKSK